VAAAQKLHLTSVSLLHLMNRQSWAYEICLPVNYEQTYTFGTAHFCNILTVIPRNMAALRRFEVMFDKFNVVGVCTNGKSAQKWITVLYNYEYVILDVL
jgi:hypothetical protein